MDNYADTYASNFPQRHRRCSFLCTSHLDSTEFWVYQWATYAEDEVVGLWDLIKRWKRAIRLKAHPRIIEKFEKEKDKEAERIASLLKTKGSDMREVVRNMGIEK